MKLLGIFLVALYAGLMLFAIRKEASKSLPSAIIAVGCALIGIYAFLRIIGEQNPLIVLIAGMLSISAGTLMNGFRSNAIHIWHHIIRFLIEAIITVICWYGT